MQWCWCGEPALRPSFTEVSEGLVGILERWKAEMEAASLQLSLAVGDAKEIPIFTSPSDFKLQ